MTRGLGILAAGSASLWVLVAIPVSFLFGADSLIHSSTALGLCLIPTAATFAWSSYALNQSPENQLVAILGGTGVRMAIVLFAGWALFALVPVYKTTSFMLWLGVFYFVTLSIEIGLLLKRASATQPLAASESKD